MIFSATRCANVGKPKAAGCGKKSRSADKKTYYGQKKKAGRGNERKNRQTDDEITKQKKHISAGKKSVSGRTESVLEKPRWVLIWSRFSIFVNSSFSILFWFKEIQKSGLCHFKWNWVQPKSPISEVTQIMTKYIFNNPVLEFTKSSRYLWINFILKSWIQFHVTSWWMR